MIYFSGLSGVFIKEVQLFVKQLFLSGQNDLQSRNDHDHEPKDDGKEKSVINKFKLNVLTNAICVDILVCATKDENGKDIIFDHLFEPLQPLLST